MGNLLFEQYEERLIRRGRTEQTVYNFRNVYTQFVEWLRAEGLTPTTATSADIERYFDSLPYANSTKRTKLVNLRSAYSYAHKRGLVQSNPTVDVELAPPATPRPRVLTYEDLRTMKLRAEGNQTLWLLFHLFAYTGIRRNEGRELAWAAVNLEQATLDVVGKGQKRRLVPVHPALGEVLVDVQRQSSRDLVLPGRAGNFVSPGSMARWLRLMHPTATFHDFRRTVASSLDANGVVEGEIMRIMGWQPKTIFDRHYRSVAGDRLQSAILKLYSDNPI